MTDDPPTVTTERSTDETVRFRSEQLDEWVAGEVDDVRCGEGYASATVIEGGLRGRIFDLESHYDPRVGWTAPRVFRRDYDSIATEVIDEGELAAFEVVSLGIDPDSLHPGDTLEHVDGGRYRVVVPPAEREYDQQVLAYALDDRKNVVEKVDPDDLLADTLVGPKGGEQR